MAPAAFAKVIVNPLARAGAAGKKWPKIQQALTEAGLHFHYRLTQRRGEAAEFAEMAVHEGYDLVVVVGGDGTINEVVNGLLATSKRGTALGIVNMGTAGDFAASLALPKKLQRAAELLASDRRTWVDAGEVEYTDGGKLRKRFFINVVGAGFDAALVQAARQVNAPVPKLPYAVAFLKTVAAYHLKRVCLEMNGERDERDVLMVLISNGRYVGTLPISPHAELGDGQFEVTSFELPVILKMLRALPKHYLKRPIVSSEVYFKRAGRVELTAQEPMMVQADGELLGELPATVRIIPHALKVVA